MRVEGHHHAQVTPVAKEICDFNRDMAPLGADNET